ncbi:Uncharacterized protein Fot_43752 [Forsythia ovata]|uniref:Uncharacterized protein n=1 Tax=Forsythia ovata TaxID=205694 RepID=A0ABD1R1N3_9LAMI
MSDVTTLDNSLSISALCTLKLAFFAPVQQDPNLGFQHHLFAKFQHGPPDPPLIRGCKFSIFLTIFPAISFAHVEENQTRPKCKSSDFYSVSGSFLHIFSIRTRRSVYNR